MCLQVLRKLKVVALWKARTPAPPYATPQPLYITRSVYPIAVRPDLVSAVIAVLQAVCQLAKLGPKTLPNQGTYATYLGTFHVTSHLLKGATTILEA